MRDNIPLSAVTAYETDRLQLLDKFDDGDGQILFKMKRETNPAAMTHLVPTDSCRQLISESDFVHNMDTVIRLLVRAEC